MIAKLKTSRGTTPGAIRLSDTAYDRILEGLFDRQIPAGSFISQGELSTIVDVPVGPLRDALRVLEAEGIVTIHPRSGIQFIRPGMELTRATYQFRTIIESSAVRAFAERADESIMDDLDSRHRQLVRSIEENGIGPDQLVEIDVLERGLHGAVVATLQNPLIESYYRRIHNYLKLLRLDRKFTVPLVLRTLKEHLDIIEACRSRDADRAETALKNHFQAAVQRNLGLI